MMQARVAGIAALFLVAMSVGSDVASGQQTWRVSLSSTGSEGDHDSYDTSISDDGRFVAFWSAATNLVPGDSGTTADVFVRDRLFATIERVSVDSTGNEANAGSYFPSISANGQFVAFHSDASNLTPGDTNGFFDVFVRERATNTTVRMSFSTAGVQGDNHSFFPAISADGVVVAFHSLADNLVAGDSNGKQDVFIHDRVTGVTERVSVGAAGVQANGDSAYPSISSDGRFVAFESLASNLVAGDTNGSYDVFVRDRLLATTERVSVDSSGAGGNTGATASSISGDGLYVVFSSASDNLVPGDGNGTIDVFLRDRQLGLTTRVSVDSAGGEADSLSLHPSIALDGRCVAFESAGTNLVPGDANGTLDVFVHDRLSGTTVRVSVDSAGTEGNSSSYFPAISGDGRFTAFSSVATNLVSGDLNGLRDAFVHGPHLTLEAIPDTVTTGASLDLAMWTGGASGITLLALVDANGTPLFVPVIYGAFDGSGVWIVPAIVPAGLSGNVLTFLGFGEVPGGRAGTSNRETVTFQ